jgi:hypothetical protein
VKANLAVPRHAAAAPSPTPAPPPPPVPLTVGRPGQDPEGWLPPESAERLRRLRQAYRGLIAQREDLRQRAQRRRDELGRLEVARSEAAAVPTHTGLRIWNAADLRNSARMDAGPLDVRVAVASEDRAAMLLRLDQDIAAARAELDRLLEEDARLAEQAAPRGALLRDVENWLKRAAGLPRGAVQRGPAPKPPPAGADLRGLVDDLRRQISACRAELDLVREAPYPAKAAKAAAAAMLERLARPPNVGTAIASGGEPALPKTVIHAVGAAPALVVDAVGLLVWACGDVLRDRLNMLIDDASDDARALDAQQRAERSADARREMLAAERAEVAAVEAAELAGLAIGYRPDTDGRALLRLADTVVWP